MSADMQWVKKALSRPIFLMLPVFWLNWTLLLWNLADQSLWIDEWFTVDIVCGPWSTLIPHIIQTERRPPLHYVLLKLWALLGEQEYVLRIYSVILVLGSVAFLYVIGRQMLGRRSGFLAALLLATSPFMVLYGRMVRAYSQTVLLSLIATWCLWQALNRPGLRNWLLYSLSALMLLYTDYSGIAVFGAHLLLILVRSFSYRQAPITGLGASLIVVLGYIPWVPFIAAHAGHPVRITDLATGIVGFVLKLVYPWFSWGAGETIFPWNPAAIGGVICGLLVLYGLATLYRVSKSVLWLLVVWFVVPLLFTAILLTFVATDIPFLNAASRTPGAVPAFYLSVAAGIFHLRRRFLPVLALLLIGGTFIAALLNYYGGREFHNPIYAVPVRQVVEDVGKNSEPRDLIVAEPDTLFGYYYNQSLYPAQYQDADCTANKTYIQTYRPPRVWLVIFGRDSTASVGCTELAEWLRQVYPRVETRGYVPQDAIYRRVKERLLNRPAYLYKLTVLVYSQ